MSKQKKETPKVHKDLKGFDIKIDKFGEIKRSLNMDEINEFLDKNLDDKKLKKED